VLQTVLPPPRVVEGMWVVPLHSILTLEEQRLGFKPPPAGARKIVLATNVAETSITIPDVVYVVDGGRCKQRIYDPVNKLSMLAGEWISQASAEQRRGRAGRVRPGVCYRLYPRPLYSALPAYGVPELQRVPLEELCLQILHLGLGDPFLFLAQAMDPPEPRAVKSALEVLQNLGAVRERRASTEARGGSGSSDQGAGVRDAGRWELTPLGHCLAQLPLEPHLGKMLVMGATLGVLDPVLTMAAAASVHEPFIRPPADQAEYFQGLRAQLAGAKGKGDPLSDHLALAMAYRGFRAAVENERTYRRYFDESGHFCQQFNISRREMGEIGKLRTQLSELLSDVGLLRPPPWFKVLTQAAAPASTMLSQAEQLQLQQVDVQDKGEWTWTGGYTDSKDEWAAVRKQVLSGDAAQPGSQEGAAAEWGRYLEDVEGTTASTGRPAAGHKQQQFLDPQQLLEIEELGTEWWPGDAQPQAGAQPELVPAAGRWQGSDTWLRSSKGQAQAQGRAAQGTRPSLLSLEAEEEGGLGAGVLPGEPRLVRGVDLQWSVRDASRNAMDVEMVKGVLVAGLYPQVAMVELLRRQGGARTKKRKTVRVKADRSQSSWERVEQREEGGFYRFQVRTLQDGEATMGSTSLVHGAYKSAHELKHWQGAPWLRHRWMVYSSKMLMTNQQLYLEKLSPVCDAAVLLFAGDLAEAPPDSGPGASDSDSSDEEEDGWLEVEAGGVSDSDGLPPSDVKELAIAHGVLRFQLPSAQAAALMALRSELDALLQAILQEPGVDHTARRADLAARVRRVLTENASRGNYPQEVDAKAEEEEPSSAGWQ